MLVSILVSAACGPRHVDTIRGLRWQDKHTTHRPSAHPAKSFEKRISFKQAGESLSRDCSHSPFHLHSCYQLAALYRNKASSPQLNPPIASARHHGVHPEATESVRYPVLLKAKKEHAHAPIAPATGVGGKWLCQHLDPPARNQMRFPPTRTHIHPSPSRHTRHTCRPCPSRRTCRPGRAAHAARFSGRC